VTAAFECRWITPRAASIKPMNSGRDDLILRRCSSLTARTRAFLNDQPGADTGVRSSAARLRRNPRPADDRALVDTATHRRLLDAYGSLEPKPRSKPGWTLARARAARRAHRREVERGTAEADWLRCGRGA